MTESLSAARRWWSWTISFVRDFGWRSYLTEIVWGSWKYRAANWRCWLRHDLGPTDWQYEEGFRHEGWRYCQRKRCEYCERDDS